MMQMRRRLPMKRQRYYQHWLLLAPNHRMHLLKINVVVFHVITKENAVHLWAFAAPALVTATLLVPGCQNVAVEREWFINLPLVRMLARQLHLPLLGKNGRKVTTALMVMRLKRIPHRAIIPTIPQYGKIGAHPIKAHKSKKKNRMHGGRQIHPRRHATNPLSQWPIIIRLFFLHLLSISHINGIISASPQRW